jgi:uncharacterized membrane protein YqaE (UPF0057 family)
LIYFIRSIAPIIQTLLAYQAFLKSGEYNMRLLLAIFLPFVTFFTIGRPISGIVCLILQITLIGWIPAAIWAVFALGQYKTDKKIEKALGAKS